MQVEENLGNHTKPRAFRFVSRSLAGNSGQPWRLLLFVSFGCIGGEPVESCGHFQWAELQRGGDIQGADADRRRNRGDNRR